MTRVERWDCLLKGTEWLVAAVAGLLVLSLGLWAYGVYVADSASLPWMFLSLFLAAWVGLVGMAGIVLIPLWVAIRASKTCR